MSPDIELAGGYFITADKYQWVLKKRKENGVSTLGFYTQIPNLVRDILRKEISESGATSFAELEKLINDWGSSIEQAIIGGDLL